MIFVIIDKQTKRVLGFTYSSEYKTYHPEVELIQISQDSEVFLSATPQSYVYDASTNSFVIK
ncbi:hypothetical protein Hydth_0544 [Hydrogenobacter thermophilus TK-6]|uniref:Uncharacterized protein n=1 Tax=Hydrogenobacter thermophilus (strain DSM 6534 / IAM 12695 / TK-6) TaxID=608538 RepID=D3DGQ6_HYDTT|nr:hypothetical protein [Hydrogenobacter thermophilus]ADO44944.1 hypothetical protein Hydth_0544 [Hydrogenobacter thermophilus TK-6]BAI69008.1 hypothetical protein HTH_0546 [Hydrogenobacter thermophilus TK-6]